MAATFYLDEVEDDVETRSLVSRWYKPGEMNYLLAQTIVGDLLEMRRGFYSHWAIYAGEILYVSESVSCVYHCGSDPRLHCGNVVFRCMFFHKIVHGIGAVAVEPLDEVCGKSYIRINNKNDEKWAPLPPDRIIGRAERLRIDPEEYDWLLNNCEHFAKWCRYGVKRCSQVKRKIVGFARYAGAYMPPVAMLNLEKVLVQGSAFRDNSTQRT